MSTPQILLPPSWAEAVFFKIRSGDICIFKRECLALRRAHISADLQNYLPRPALKGLALAESFFFFFFFFFFGLLRASPVAYGHSQARGLNRIHSHEPTPQPQQRQIGAASTIYTIAHSNARTLTH